MTPPLNRSPLTFFGLVFALTVPFWVLGSLITRQLLPALPISALAVICPVSAAAILVYRQNGPAGVSALFKRALDFRTVSAKGWLAAALLLEPAIMIASYWLIRLRGTPLPAPQITPGPAAALFTLFLVGGLAEELGWTGYVTDPLQERFGALGGSLILGGVWAVWHFVGLWQAHRSLEFVAWWTLSTIAYRVIIVWLYNNTAKSVFAAALFHAMINLTWQLFPVDGSFYDPKVTGLIAAAVALGAVLLYGPRTLAGRRSRLALSH